MFKKSKVLLLMLVALMAVALVFTGCSQPAADTGSDTGDGAAAAEVVKIGFFAPITGENAAEGCGARNAFQMAIDAANASGQFPYKIELIVIDDQSTDSVAVAGAQKVVADQQVVAASGFWNSGPAEAASAVFKDAEIPLLIWGAIRDSLTSAENYPWITRSAPTAGQENSASAAVVLDDLGYTDWFLVSDLSDYGQGNLEVFNAELESRGLKALGSELVQEDAQDFSAQVAKIKESGAKAVYCGSTVAIASKLKLQLYEAGVTDILFAGISGMKTPDFLKIGADAAEGALVVSPGVDLSTNEAGVKFVEAYNAAGFSEPIGAYTPYAYEAALIMLNALGACGDAPTPELMVDAIKDSETTGIFGTTTFDEIGQTTNVATYLNVVQNGEWVNYINSDYATGARAFGGK